MDVFYTSSAEVDAAEPDEHAGAAAGAVNATLTPARPIGQEAWRQWLEAQGFSHAEASRLMFERLRPRDEGTSRD